MRIDLEEWLQRLADLTSQANRPTTWLVCAGCQGVFRSLRLTEAGDGLCPTCYPKAQQKGVLP